MSAKHSQLAGTLTDEILSGRYQAGDRLPSERELAVRFNVNRGAVREAMSRLSQLGVADVQPGGARVAPINEASLDIIGHMLASTQVPDAQLLGQIFQVVERLLSMAAEALVERGRATDIEAVRARVLQLLDSRLDSEAHAAARIEMMRTIMITSGNLVCQLIAHGLFKQFAPTLEAVKPYVQLDVEQFNRLARRLDGALATRDRRTVREVFDDFSELHNRTLTPAIEAAVRQSVRPSESITRQNPGPSSRRSPGANVDPSDNLAPRSRDTEVAAS